MNRSSLSFLSLVADPFDVLAPPDRTQDDNRLQPFFLALPAPPPPAPASELAPEPDSPEDEYEEERKNLDISQADPRILLLRKDFRNGNGS